MNYSKTFIGIIAAALVTFGLLSEAEALTLSNALMVLVPLLFALYGRWKAGNVTWIGVK
jgi:hypothetical protein